MLSVILPSLIFSALALALLGAWRRSALWRQGRPAAVPFWRGLAAMPRRYLVDLHDVVARDKSFATTHVFTGAGFVASALLLIAVHGFRVEAAWASWGLLLAAAGMAIGALRVLRRRRNPPPRLSRGPWQRLPRSLLAFAGGSLLAALPGTGLLSASIVSASFAGWVAVGLLLALLVWGLAELFLGMTWGGPMKHAFAGALHLAFHPRPERFAGGRSSGLRPLDLGDPGQSLGVSTPRDFAWNQLLGFDACVQCGRCEAMCPAFAAGQPLNPKKLIQDLVVGMRGGSDQAYAGSPHPGQEVGAHAGAPASPIVVRDGKALLAADTVWACTTCRACVEECPMMIEHVDAIVGLRRQLTLEQGATPNKGAAVLENLEATDNPGGFDPATRMHWAADLELPRMAERGRADVLLWLGDGAFDLRNQRTLRALVKVLRAAHVDFAVLGDEERDSGDVARRLGDEAGFQRLARSNIATLARYRFAEIVTCDPHSFHVLKNEYGALGGHFNVVHHSTYIARLLEQRRLKLAAWTGDAVTYHDPCYLGRYNGEYAAPRQVLQAVGIRVVEMERSGFRSRCCGGGGGAPITDIPGQRRIPDMRMDEIKATGAATVAVGCPQCTAMLDGVVGAQVAVRDLAEIVAAQLVEAAVTPSRQAEEIAA